MRRALLLLLGLLPSLATAEPPGDARGLVDAFVTEYVNAWQSRNPFHLVDLAAPGSHAFDPLLDQPRFDTLRETSVRVTGIEVLNDNLESGRVTARFIKDHEDLFLDGTLTRGVARVTVDLRVVEVGAPGSLRRVLRVLTHNVAPSPIEPTLVKKGDEPRRALSERRLYAAIGLIREGRFDVAFEQLNAAIDAGASLQLRLGAERFQAQLHYFRAVCMARTGAPEAAATALAQALELNAEFPLALNELGELKIGAGDLSGAKGHFERSLKLFDEQPAIADRLDFLSHALDDFTAGEERDAYLKLRGVTPQQALDTARGWMRKSPFNKEWRRLVAVLLLETHLPDDAEKVLASAIRDSTPEELYVLAQSALARGDSSEALKRFHELWRVAPNYRDAVVYLSELSAREQRWRSATAYLKEALAQRPDAPDLLFKLGVYTLRLGRRFEALTYFQQARENRPPQRIRRALHNLIVQL